MSISQQAEKPIRQRWRVWTPADRVPRTVVGGGEPSARQDSTKNDFGDILGPEDFPEFGDLNPLGVFQARPGAEWAIATVIATNPGPRAEVEALCIKTHPSLFMAIPTLKLLKPSLQIPAEEIVISVRVDPYTIPDDPPAKVTWRWSQAYFNIFPNSIGYLIEAIGDLSEPGNPKPLLVSQFRAREAQNWDRRFERAERWGWALRAGRRAVDLIRNFERARLERARARAREIERQNEILRRQMKRSLEAAEEFRRKRAQLHRQLADWDRTTSGYEFPRPFGPYDPILCIGLPGNNRVNLVNQWDHVTEIVHGRKMQYTVIE